MTRWLQAAKSPLGGSDKTDKTDKTSDQLGHFIDNTTSQTAVLVLPNGVSSVLSVLSEGGKADFRNGDGVQPSPAQYDPEALNAEFDERAAILEFDAGFARREAERRARLDIFGSDAKEESQ